METFGPSLTPDWNGRVTWGFISACASLPGTYELRLVHEATGLRSNAVPLTIRYNPACAGPLADLVAEGVTLDRFAARAGGWIDCRFTLRNQGTNHAEPSVTRLRLGRSSDRSAVTDVFLADVPAPRIPVGSAITFDHTVHLPADLTPGTYFIWIVADNGSAVLQRVGTGSFARSAPLLVSAP